MFVPNFKILGAEVPEQSLTEKFTHRYTETYTDIIMEKTELYTPILCMPR